MAILEKEVLIGLVPLTIKHYESKGYHIPRKRNNQNKLVIPRGTKILVKVEDLTRGSNVLLNRVCDSCLSELNPMTYNNILSLRIKGDGEDRCTKCGSTKRWREKKTKIDYNFSLEFYAISSGEQCLLDEYSSKNHNPPSNVYKTSGDMAIWKCKKCNSEYNKTIGRRVNNRDGCPYCSGRKANTTNCLWTTHPHVAELLFDKNKGYQLTHGSNETEVFVCDDCGHKSKKIIVNVTKQGFKCPKCSDGLSYPEKFIFSLLDQAKVDFEYQKSFTWSNNKRYDFYIPSLKCIVEVHGAQHYKEGFQSLDGKTLQSIQENDRNKLRDAKLNGVDNYIIVNFKLSQMDFIICQLKNSQLRHFIDLDLIDFKKCHSNACKTIIKKVCDIWKYEDKSISQISKDLQLHETTIRDYLLKGSEIGFCEFKPKFSSKKRQVVQLSLSGNLIREWDSVLGAAKHFNTSDACIRNACIGKTKTSQGYQWMYLIEYEKNKDKIQIIEKCGESFLPRPVVQLDLNGNYIGQFSTVSKAVKLTGLTHITDACRGHRKTSGGYKWMYKEDYEVYIKEQNKELVAN